MTFRNLYQLNHIEFWNFPLNKKITQDKELPYTLKINCFNEMEFPTILFAIGHNFLIKCRLFKIITQAWLTYRTHKYNFIRVYFFFSHIKSIKADKHRLSGSSLCVGHHSPTHNRQRNIGKIVIFHESKNIRPFFTRVAERKLSSIHFFLSMAWGAVGRNNELRWETTCFVLRKK